MHKKWSFNLSKLLILERFQEVVVVVLAAVCNVKRGDATPSPSTRDVA